MRRDSISNFAVCFYGFFVQSTAGYAVPLAKALVEGGLPCAEVTFRTEAAEESIRK